MNTIPPPPGILTDEEFATIQAAGGPQAAPPEDRDFMAAQVNQYKAFRISAPRVEDIEARTASRDFLDKLTLDPDSIAAANNIDLIAKAPPDQQAAIRDRLVVDSWLTDRLRSQTVITPDGSTPAPELDPMRRDEWRDALSQELFGDNAPRGSDPALVAKLRERSDERRRHVRLLKGQEGTDDAAKASTAASLARWAARSAYAGESAVQGFAKWKAQARTSPNWTPIAEKQALFEAWSHVYGETKAKAAPYQAAVRQTLENLKALAGAKDVTGMPDQSPQKFDAAIAPLMNLDERTLLDVALPALRSMAELDAKPGGTGSFWDEMKDQLAKSLMRPFGQGVGAVRQNAMTVGAGQGAALAENPLAAMGVIPFTPEEARKVGAAVDKAQGENLVRTMLRSAMTSDIDPIKPNAEGPVGKRLEQMAYDVAGTVAYMTMLSVPYAGTAMATASFADDNTAMLLNKHPDMKASDARAIATIAAPIQTAIEQLQRLQVMGRVPIFNKLMNRLAGPGGNAAVRFGIYGATGSIIEYTEEKLQDAAPLAVQALASALKQDIPQANLDGFEAFELRTFLAVAPFALIGAGVNVAQDKAAMRQLVSDEAAMRAVGFSEDGIQTIQAAETTEAQTQAIRQAWETRDTTAPADERWQETVRKAGEEAQAAAVKQVADMARAGGIQEWKRHTDGTFSITLADGTIATASNPLELGVIIEQNTDAAQGWDEVQPFIDIMDALNARTDAPTGAIDLTVEERPNVAPLITRLTDTANDEALPEPVRAEAARMLESVYRRADIYESLLARQAAREGRKPDKIDWNKVTIAGQSAMEVREGVATAVIRLDRGASVYDLTEETVEADFSALERAGEMSVESAAADLRRIEERTGDTYLTNYTGKPEDRAADRLAVVEAISRLVLVYGTGTARTKSRVAGVLREYRKTERAKLIQAEASGVAPRIMDVLRKKAEWLKLVVLQAIRLNKARRAARDAGEEFPLERFLQRVAGVAVETQAAEQVTDAAAEVWDDEGLTYIPPEGDELTPFSFQPSPYSFSFVEEYGINHRPNDEGPRAFDLAENNLMPKDVYDHPEWYSAMEPKVIRETMTQLRKVKGKPDAELVIYRAGPVGEMNPGDWVSLSKEYARTHATSQDPETFKVWQAKVKAADVRWAMDDLAEFGYWGEQKPADDTGVSFSFQPSEPAAENLTSFSFNAAPLQLSALHNLTEDGLRYADKLGGLAVPSIAVVPTGNAIRGFGDVTLIGGRSLADPEANPVFNLDAYTARFPRPDYKAAPAKKADALMKRIKPFSVTFDDGIASEIWDGAVNYPDPVKSADRAKYSRAAKAWFLSEVAGVEVQPIRQEYKGTGWLNHPAVAKAIDAGAFDLDFNDEAGRKAFGDAIREAVTDFYSNTDPAVRSRLIGPTVKRWVQDDGLSVYNTVSLKREFDRMGKMELDVTATEAAIDEAMKGREIEFADWVTAQIVGIHDGPRIRVKGKLQPYTLDNIVAAMTSGKTAAAEQTMTMGENKVRALAAQRFTDLEKMRTAAASSIKTEDEVDAATKAIREKLAIWRQEAAPFWKYTSAIDSFDAAMEAMASVMRGAITGKRMHSAMQKAGFTTIPQSLSDRGAKLARELYDSPVPYFESKPQRAVRLSEFSGAVIRDDASPETRAILEANGIRAVEIPAASSNDINVRGAAAAALASELNVSFSFQPTAEDARHAALEARAKAGDAEATADAQAMVDAAAKAAGYVEGGYHNTDAEFDTFRPSTSGKFGPGIYWSRTPRMKFGSRVIRAFLKFSNPLVVDKNAPAEYLKKTGNFITGVTQDAMEKGGFDAILASPTENVVRDPSQIKSADPFTYDDAGNLIPLSKRFDPTRDEISFSFQPTAILDDLAAKVEARMSRSPQARLDAVRAAVDNLAALKQAWQRRRDGAGISDERSKASIDAEADVRQAFRAAELMQQAGISYATAREIVEGRRRAYEETLARETHARGVEDKTAAAIRAEAKMRGYFKRGELREVVEIDFSQAWEGKDRGTGLYDGPIMKLLSTTRRDKFGRPSRIGNLLSLKNAKKLYNDGKVLQSGRWDGAKELPQAFFQGEIKPDDAAKTILRAFPGEFPPGTTAQDVSTDMLWDAIHRELRQSQEWIELERREKDRYAEADAESRNYAEQWEAEYKAQLEAARMAAEEAASAYVATATDGNEAAEKATAQAAKEAAAWKRKALTMQNQDWNSKETLVRAMRTLDAILSAFPAAVRGKVGGWLALARIGTQDRMAEEIDRRITILDRELERELRKDALEELDALRERAKPKREAGKRPSGKLGAEAHRFFQRIEAVADLTAEEVETAGITLDTLATTATTPEEQADVYERQQILDQFGGLDSRDAAGVPLHDAQALAAALAAAETVYETGRNQWRTQEEARLAEVQAMAQEVTAAVGAAPLSRILAQGDAAKKLSGMLKGGTVSLRSFREVLHLIMGRDNPLAKQWADRAMDAMHARTDELADIRRRWRGAMEAATGQKRHKAEARVWDMGTKRTVAVTVRPGRPVPDTIPIESIPNLAGLGYNAAEIADAEAAFLALPADSRAQNITITRWQKDAEEAVSLTDAEAVYYSMLWRQEQYRENLNRAGFGQETQDEIEAGMSDAAKALREYIAGEYAAGYYPLASLFRGMFGVDLPQIANYAPGKWWSRGVEKAMDPSGAGMVEGGFRAGMLKDRKAHLAEPKPENAFALWLGHVSQTAHWKAVAPLARELWGVFGHPEVKKAITARHGAETLDALTRWLDAIEANGVKTNFPAWAQTLLGWQANVKLAWKVGTILKQSTGLIAAAYRMPLKAYASGMRRLVTGQLEVKDIWESPMIQRRLESGFAPEVRAAMSRTFTDAPTLRRRFVQQGMELIGYADAFFATASAAIHYDWQLSRIREAVPGISDAAAKRHAMRETQLVVNATAQPVEITERSLMEMGGFGKVFLIFGSEARQKSSMWITAWSRVLRKQATEEDWRTLAIMHLIVGPMTQVIGSAMMDARDDDDDEWFDEKNWQAWDFVRSMALGPMAGIPIIRDLTDGFSGDSGPTAQTAKAMQSAVKIVKGPEDSEDETVEWYAQRTAEILKGADSFTAVAAGIGEQAFRISDNLMDTREETQAKIDRLARKAKAAKDEDERAALLERIAGLREALK